MGRSYPALDVRGADPELVQAAVDEFAPTAVEEFADGLSIFFTNLASREAARLAIAQAFPLAVTTVRDVDDEDWAARSQADLTPVTVGRITVTPPWCAPPSTLHAQPSSLQRTDSPSVPIVIAPSMGFGTGHHATTRLCLAALQSIDVAGTRVLDVGTGSGVLALAASALGARDVVGIDHDADAIRCAIENRDANPFAAAVTFRTADVREETVDTADIVLANLTGAVLINTAGRLASALRPGGRLIVSGLQSHERDAVIAAFAEHRLTWSAEEAGWVGLMFVCKAGTPMHL